MGAVDAKGAPTSEGCAGNRGDCARLPGEGQMSGKKCWF